MAMTEADGRKHHIGVKAGEVGRYVLLPGDPDRVERIAKWQPACLLRICK